MFLFTVTLHVASTPFDAVAEITVLPSFFATITPCCDTNATVGSLLLHVIFLFVVEDGTMLTTKE